MDLNTVSTTVNDLLIKVKEEWLKRKSDKSTAISIGAAVSLLFLYSAYDKVCRPNKNIRHIPYVSFFQYFKSLASGKSHNELSNKYEIPLITSSNDSKSEIFVKMDILSWTIHCASPEGAKQIFLKTDIFPKADTTRQKGTLRFDYIGIDNIVSAFDKSEWKKHRMLVNPAFHRSRPLGLFAETTNKVFKLIDSNNGEPTEVTDIMDRFALDIIGRNGFGYDFNSISKEENVWVTTYHELRNNLQNPLFTFFPSLEQNFLWLFPARKRAHQLATKFHGMLREVIENKRKQMKENGYEHIAEADRDILTLMLEGELKGEGKLSDEELIGDLNVFFIAGHDTTANALSSFIYYLAKYPEVQKRAREEAIKIFGDAPEDISPTDAQISELKYINQAIKETLRMNGPATQVTPRVVAKDTEISGVFIPKGSYITVDIYDLHHNPKIWKDPEVFNPDRFVEGGEAETNERSGLGWAPFASGSRMCIGMNFSLAEQRVMISCLLRKYEWSLPAKSIHEDTLKTNSVGVIGPKELNIIFKRRY
ncbi:unnamed protein product [Cunninghamella blakesleeana]